MNRIETLETPRLWLRRLKLSDATRTQMLAGSRAVADTTRRIPHPYEMEEAVHWLKWQEKEAYSTAFSNFAICFKENDALIGVIGLNFESHDQSAELGYWLGQPYWGQGLCTEAAREMIAHAFRDWDMHRVYAQCFSRNPASGRVLQKIGMKWEGRLREHVKKWDQWEDVEVFGLLRSEWKE